MSAVTGIILREKGYGINIQIIYMHIYAELQYAAMLYGKSLGSDRTGLRGLTDCVDKDQTVIRIFNSDIVSGFHGKSLGSDRTGLRGLTDCSRQGPDSDKNI